MLIARQVFSVLFLLGGVVIPFGTDAEAGWYKYKKNKRVSNKDLKELILNFSLLENHDNEKVCRNIY